MSGCQKLSDEDSRDVEEEDDPEDEESFSEVKSSVDCVGRRNWRVRIFITPPDSFLAITYYKEALNLTYQRHSRGMEPCQRCEWFHFFSQQRESSQRSSEQVNGRVQMKEQRR